MLESLEQPTTHNHPLKKDGFPGKPLVTTIEHKFRVAQLETDFIVRNQLKIFTSNRFKIESKSLAQNTMYELLIKRSFDK